MMETAAVLGAMLVGMALAYIAGYCRARQDVTDAMRRETPPSPRFVSAKNRDNAMPRPDHNAVR